MRDQAASLRALKANYDKLVTKPKAETTEQFLQGMRRPSPLVAVAMIYPDNLTATYPSVATWLPKLSRDPSQLYLWDQAALVRNKSLTEEEGNSLPFPILPKQVAMLDLPSKTHSEKFDFLRNIASTLDNHQEVWITIKASEISYYKNLLSAANSLCIILPECQDSILKVYETVKGIHNLEINSKINLLEFSTKPFIEATYNGDRIKNVAKQFLGIDLGSLGVVLSNGRYIPPTFEGDLLSKKTSSDSSDDCFMYSFSLNIVNH